MTHYFNSTIRLPASPKQPAKQSRKKRAAGTKSKAVRDAERLFDVACEERRERHDGKKCNWPWCFQVATERHHVLKRRYWTMGLVVPETAWKLVRFLCTEHHAYAESRHQEARMKGVSVDLWEAVLCDLARSSNKSSPSRRSLGGGVGEQKT